ncbi:MULTISPECIES: DUF1127 domain-containing protein [unclassified Sinorhizobium]|uniref:DUF1127 domain-containing protein n=1 Tax=unclassified Sinorhizobium TaxID=2613772 RepID=UPI003526449C
MSFERNSNHQYGLDRRFPELVAANGKASPSDRTRDRHHDWSPFRDPLAYDRSVPERPAYERTIVGGATNRQPAAPQSPPHVGWSASLGTGLYRLWANWQHKREIARSIEHLRELDDHLLRDIGLERWQIQGR